MARRQQLTIIILAILLSACVRTAPREATVWNKCDGYAAPEGEGKLLGRVALTAATLGIVNAQGENNKPWAKLHGQAGVDACNELMTNSTLDAFPMRKLNVLRARAIHNLEANNTEAALSDANAMYALVDTITLNKKTSREVDSAIKVIEANALITTGQTDKGAEILQQLLLEKPYSRSHTAKLIGLMPKGWQNSDKYKPMLQTLAHFSLAPIFSQAVQSVGEFPGTPENLSQWEYLVEAGYQVPKSTGSTLPRYSFRPRNEQASTIVNKNRTADDLVYAIGATEQARYGNIERAYEWLSQLNKQTEAQKKIYARMRKIVDIYRDYHAGDMEKVKQAYQTATDFPATDVTYSQIRLIQKAVPEAERTGLLKSDVAKLKVANAIANRNFSQLQSNNSKFSSLFSLLPLWQPFRSGHDSFGQSYSLLGGKGFNTKKQDDGTWLITFTGEFSSKVAIEEMTLLKAAQLTQKEKAEAFIVEKQNDYNRTRYVTYNGVASGAGTAAGFKTEMVISLLSQGDIENAPQSLKDRAFYPDPVINDLLPLYETEGQRIRRLKKEAKERKRELRKQRKEASKREKENAK
ncbi:hypothetical protein [Kordiimonas sp. SCSIO 12610]|uniref:hypothetical protein n=1 Tax=Kordiimonas sp. SCSIO 12610 TaxID=2829597 RepID=UPI00210CC0EB|nr:hypothetical protein [Kordiimonas sp. SCSIO 12610]UTW56064.1 hypothetical protein KFF44_03995 [Kordiimonas sp. SCSIO 12610]